MTAPPSTIGRRTRSLQDRSGAPPSAAARLGSRIPPVALAYAVPALVAAVAVQTWFRGDAGLASGDLVPPVTPGIDYRGHWNGFDSGAGAPGYQIVSLPYFEGLRLFSWLGLGEATFQRLWLTVLVAGTAAGVVFLARGIVRSPLAAATAGFVPLFSAYRLTVAFDPIPLVAMIAATALGGLVVRAGGRNGPRPLVFALASLCCGFVALNPPHLALVIAWIAVCVLLAWAVHGRQALPRMGRFLLAGIPLALLFNLWWIVPAALTITGSVFDDRFAAAGVDEWAWTHARANVLNVIAFTSSWAWPYPEYFPFSTRLERFPFAALKYVPAVAAVIGLILAKGRWRRVALVLAAVGVLASWVMKGLHDPLAGTNQWLYDHMPGFWLLRDPTKTGLVLVLVFALLAAIGISQLAERSRRTAAAAALLVVTAAAAYAHPVFTGAVIPTERPLLPSARVTVPPGWQAAAAYIESRPANGKVVVLPRLDYYQTPTTWGYYGASFLHQLIDRPVIEPLPDAYYRDPEVDALVGRLQAEILRGGHDVSGVLQALGARYVVLRRDLDTAFPGRSLVSPDLLDRRLAGRTDLRHLAGFGQADVYEAPGVETPEVYAAVPLIEAATGVTGAQRALVPPPGAAAVPVDAADALGEVVAGRAAVASPTRPGGRLAVEVEGDAVVIRSFERPSAPLVTLPAPDPPFAVIADSRRFTVRDAPDGSRRLAVLGPPKLAAGDGYFPSEPIELRPSLANRVGDCNRYDDRSPSDAGIAADVTGRTVRLQARDHAACVGIPIRSARPDRPLRLRLSYRSSTGNPARLCAWQAGVDRCADLPSLDPSPGWHRFDEVLTPAAGTESVRLFLYADGVRGGRRVTRTEYRGVRVASPAPELEVAVEPMRRLPEISYRRSGPGEFRVRIEGADRPFLLVAAETFAPGWRLEAAGRDGADAEHLRVNGYANGWRVPWTGSYELTISYGPERLAEAARTLDLVAVPLGLLALILGPMRRRRPRTAAAAGRRRDQVSRRRSTASGWRRP